MIENKTTLQPLIRANDKVARNIIFGLSAFVLAVVILMGKYKPLVDIEFPFDRFIFAKINGVINTIVSILLFVGLLQIKNKNYNGHKRSMMSAIALSSLFLIFYIIHHISNGDTVFGGNGNLRYIYYTLLISHIALASIILPFILFSAYQSLSGQYEKHKKISRITWPLWLYVSVSGVIVFLFINPYYQ